MSADFVGRVSVRFYDPESFSLFILIYVFLFPSFFFILDRHISLFIHSRWSFRYPLDACSVSDYRKVILLPFGVRGSSSVSRISARYTIQDSDYRVAADMFTHLNTTFVPCALIMPRYHRAEGYKMEFQSDPISSDPHNVYNIPPK